MSPVPSLVILALTDAFSDLWPTLTKSLPAEVITAHTVGEVGGLAPACGILVAAGGAEDQASRVLRDLQARRGPPMAVVGTETDYRLPITLIKAGADDYYALPRDLGMLRSWMADRVEGVEIAGRVKELTQRQRRQYDFSRLIGRSPALMNALDKASKIIDNADATALLVGETGTGKELLARAIHYNGRRASKPFLEINCTALPENLLEAELFGYEAGAFTDARTAKPGLIEAADGGTLLLDEIGDLSQNLQGKLLRVLEDRSVRRLGSVRTSRVDIRIIAATNVDLPAAVRAGKFRQDLYYRISVVPILLPPLRDRGEDVILLASDFLTRFAQVYDVPAMTLTPEIMKVLLNHDWPGNVRELRNAIERAVLLGEGELRVEDLFVEPFLTTMSRNDLPFPATMTRIEEAAAQAMVNYCDGNKSEAAKRLGVSRKHLYALLARGEG